MKYRPEIDGLRALAVIPVILFHAGFSAFSGGYVGVDVFFVISGYLITTILVNDLDSNKFSLFEFYERRARRILPALVVTSLLTIAAAWALMNPIELRKFGNALMGVATFSSNVVFWKSQGYFDEASEINPLIHTWSLAVEEQWYIVFPILLLMLWRFNKNKVFGLLCVAAAASFLMSEWGWRNKPTAAFFLAPTRAWELLAGSIAALIVCKNGIKGNELFSIFGLVLIFVSVLFFDESTPVPSAYTLAPVIGTVLLILFCAPTTLVAKWLSAKLVVGIGLISYSAYLVHQPILAFVRLYTKDIDLSLVSSVLVVTMSLGLAYLSWKYVESPIRRRTLFESRGTIFSASVISLVMLGIIGFFLKKATDGHELAIAQQLSKADFVYFSNLDERRFTEARLFYPIRETEAVVMGSSRIMQVSSKIVGRPSLNLGVSGASVEDYIAYVGESVAKLRPREVYLGADPWLFNRNDGQDRWQSSAPLYNKWDEKIAAKKTLVGLLPIPTSTHDANDPRHNFARSIYALVNIGGSVIAKNGEREATAKKAYDGFHIYDQKSASTTYESMEKGFDGVLDYAMKDFEFDKSAHEKYRALIEWLKLNGVTPYIVLSPYHPTLYQRMTNRKPIFLELESRFRKIGEELDVKVIGSYDPTRAKCDTADFYDGMHPKESCMANIMSSRGK
jgi:peptidoglycan/LPS O-acetylase OafA/YrhL